MRTRAKRTTGKQGLRYTPRPGYLSGHETRLRERARARDDELREGLVFLLSVYQDSGCISTTLYAQTQGLRITPLETVAEMSQTHFFGAGFVVRDAAPDDAAAIQAIYAHYVLVEGDVTTFEETVPSVETMRARVADVRGACEAAPAVLARPAHPRAPALAAAAP